MASATKSHATLKEIRRTVDELDRERAGLALVPITEFRRTQVADRLRQQIEHALALSIPKRYAHESAARDVAVANALDLIAQWRKCEVDGRRVRKAGCCGR